MPVAIHRAAVDFETPHTRAASRTEPPGTRPPEKPYAVSPAAYPALWRDVGQP